MVVILMIDKIVETARQGWPPSVDDFFKTDNSIDNFIIEYNEDVERCKNCGLVDTILNCNINYVCLNCGLVQETIIFEKWRFLIGIDYLTKYTRYGHWKKILRSVQGSLVCSVPDEVMKILKTEKFNTIQELKGIMIKEKLRKYYLSIYWIYRQCKNKSLIDFPKKTYRELLRIFQKISSSFNEINFKDGRKNFFNYHYILIKFLRLLRKEEYIKHLFSMKDIKKIKYSEGLFKKICNKLEIEFIPEPLKNNKKRKYNKKIKYIY
tara:strand:- start:1621 stop:2415 length:795 start_codon:yes stop_codon:yes gene_type:complete